MTIQPRDSTEADPLKDRRQPDPDKVREWREKIDIIQGDVTSLAWSRDVFKRLRKNKGDASMPKQRDVPQRVRVWYYNDSMVAIRRILDPEANGSVVSLRVLLEEMKRNAEAMTRDSIEELADQRGIPRDDAEPDVSLRTFLVNATWGVVADESGTRLDSKKIKADLRALDDASRRIINWVNRRIAHRTTDDIPENEQPTFAEVDTCSDLIHAVTIKYIAPLTGAGYTTLVPY